MKPLSTPHERRGWTLTDGAALAIRFWGAECVVHHALSNDTHRLTAWAGRLLLALAEAAPASSAALAEAIEDDEDAVEDALRSLAELELVAAC